VEAPALARGGFLVAGSGSHSLDGVLEVALGALRSAEEGRRVAIGEGV